ncbi:MAG: hypothetical protein AB1791_15385 [Chloroflexota bacterium]
MNRYLHFITPLLFGLAFTLHGLPLLIWPFDGLYGQDAFAYYDYAIASLRENLAAGRPPPPFFWPPGYPLLIVLVNLLTGAGPLAGQLVSLAAGALVVVLTAWLAHDLFVEQSAGLPPVAQSAGLPPVAQSAGLPPVAQSTGLPMASWKLALPAGLLVALNGQLWQSSVVVMADTAALAAATLGVWTLIRYGRSPTRGAWLLLAAGAMAAAVLTRWAYALVAIPCTLYALWLLVRRGGRVPLWHGAGAALVALLILSPLWGPAVAGLLNAQVVNPPFTGDLQVYSWHPLNALRREFVTADGYLRYAWPNGLYYALAPAHRYYFTALLAPFIGVGLWAVLQTTNDEGRKTKTVILRPPSSVFLILAWAGVIYLFHAGAPWQNFRFTLAYLPPLAILAAVGWQWLYHWLPGRLRWLAVLYLAAGLLYMGGNGLQLTRSFIERKEADLATVQWVEGQTPAGARLLTFGLTLTFQHYSHLETIELFYQDPASLENVLVDGRPTYLLLDVANVESQWPNQSPGLNYHWLQENAGLAWIGQDRTYALFQVLINNRGNYTLCLHFLHSPLA